MNAATTSILTVLLLTIVSCGSPSGGGEAVAGRGDRPADGAPPDIRYHEILDPTSGVVQAVSPIPSAWQVHPASAPVYITGPRGLKVYRTETTDFAYSRDPFMQQTMLQMGHQLSPVLSLEQILDQHVKPAALAQGNRFVRADPIPEVEGFWQRFAVGMVETGSQRQFRAVGTEWEDGRGTRSFVSLVQSVLQDGQAIQWSLHTTTLEAPAEAFEEARAAYLYAIGNTRINPQWQQMMNGRLVGQLRQNQAFHQEMMAQSRAAHRQRMAAIEQWGNTARSVGDTYSEILDINHAGYLRRDSIQSAGHAATVDMIGERTLIGNHETGEHYRVDAGSRYYWVANDGTYFGTDNSLYDPRIDDRVNGVEWSKFVQERH